MKKDERNEDEQNYEVEYKFILLGDTMVGKTCLFRKITTGIFMEKNVSTVGIDKRTIKISCDFEEENKTISKNVIIHLTDTAGQERFKSITKTYYKGSDAAILLYDITEKKTFEHVKEWIDSITETTATNMNNYCIFLMGSKLDLVETGKKERQVTVEEAKNKCKECEIEWGGECSNKDFTEEQYKDIFKGYILKLYKKIGFKKFKSQNIVKLGGKDDKNNSNCICINH